MIHEFLAGTENDRSVHATADDLMLSRRQKSFTFDITHPSSLLFERKLFYLAHIFGWHWSLRRPSKNGPDIYISSLHVNSFFHTLLVNIGF